MSVFDYIAGKPAKWFVSMGYHNKSVGTRCIHIEEVYESVVDDNILDYIKFDRKITKQIKEINKNNPGLLKKYEDAFLSKKEEIRERTASLIKKHQEDEMVSEQKEKKKKKSEKEKNYNKLKKMDKKELIKMINENIDKADASYLADIAFELKYY